MLKRERAEEKTAVKRKKTDVSIKIEIQQAIKTNNFEDLLELVKDKPIDAFHTISYAIRKNNFAVVRCLLENKVSFSEKLEQRVLILACKTSNIPIIELLLSDSRVILDERVIKAVIINSDNKDVLKFILSKLPVPTFKESGDYFYNLSVCNKAGKMLASLILYAVRYKKYQNFLTLIECVLFSNTKDLSYLQPDKLQNKDPYDAACNTLYPALSKIYRYKDLEIGKNFLNLLIEFKQQNPIFNEIIDYCIYWSHSRLSDTKLRYEYKLALMSDFSNCVKQGNIYIDENSGEYKVYNEFDESIYVGKIDMTQVNLSDLPSRLEDEELISAVLAITLAKEHTCEKDCRYLAYNEKTWEFANTNFAQQGRNSNTNLEITDVEDKSDENFEFYQSAQEGSLESVQILLKGLITDKIQPPCNLLHNLSICLKSLRIIRQGISCATIHDHFVIVESLLHEFAGSAGKNKNEKLFLQSIIKPCMLDAAKNGAINSVRSLIVQSQQYTHEYNGYVKPKNQENIQITKDIIRIAALNGRVDLLKCFISGAISSYIPFSTESHNRLSFYQDLMQQVTQNEQDYPDVIQVLSQQLSPQSEIKKAYLRLSF